MILVTCAIIEHQGKVLVTQRSASMSLPMKWEFPGGKIEPSESACDCIVREIKEELAIHIVITASLTPSIHRYGLKIIQLIPFVCSYQSGTIILSEHSQFVWSNAQDLSKFDWADADVPILQEYLKTLSS